MRWRLLATCSPSTVRRKVESAMEIPDPDPMVFLKGSRAKKQIRMLGSIADRTLPHSPPKKQFGWLRVESQQEIALPGQPVFFVFPLNLGLGLW